MKKLFMILMSGLYCLSYANNELQSPEHIEMGKIKGVMKEIRYCPSSEIVVQAYSNSNEFLDHHVNIGNKNWQPSAPIKFTSGKQVMKFIDQNYSMEHDGYNIHCSYTVYDVEFPELADAKNHENSTELAKVKPITKFAYNFKLNRKLDSQEAKKLLNR